MGLLTADEWLKLQQSIRAHRTAVLLNSNQYTEDPFHSSEVIIALGSKATFTWDGGQTAGVVGDMKQWFDQHQGEWIFGHMSYEANQLFEAIDIAPSRIAAFPRLHFFVPEQVYELDHLPTVTLIEDSVGDSTSHKEEAAISYLVEREAYIDHVTKLQHHIHIGDIYEINYCHPVKIQGAMTDPLTTYLRLNQLTQAPFSAFYRLEDQYLLSASPERFFKKSGQQIICQPIKGTNRRLTDPIANESQRQALNNNEKERSENIMIVDLMRNDLGRICQPGTIEVPELCGIYTFRQVNQMISTIKGRLTEGRSITDVFEALFPMGSMTGAPKVKAMQLTAATEPFQRNIYSGTLGYVKPNGDADFNVVIRSILYDDAQQMASVSAGGAITALSVPESEYHETLLKMEAMLSVL